MTAQPATSGVELRASALPGLPDIKPGDDLGALIVAATTTAERPLSDDDLVVVSHKVVSKAEGRIRVLSEIAPSQRALQLAAGQDDNAGGDARHLQAILDETSELIRAERGVLICRTHSGLVCANAGVDRSNSGHEEVVVLLPADPDASARTLRERIEALSGVRPAVLIADSFGRPWRLGQIDVAIGLAGLTPLDDRRGQLDAYGHRLEATVIAVADQAAAAADLLRRKHSREPVVLLSGLGEHITHEHGPGAKALIRPVAENLFG